MKKRPLIVLTGPTAVGKTELSIALAKRINGEIISADSMQVYKHMDIGSAKIMPDEMQGVRHYLIGEIEPFEAFNVVKFQEYAKKYMEEIYSRGKIPIIVGGTGFYIQALLYDIDFTEQESSQSYRRQLEEEAAQYGAEYLHQRLREVDEQAAADIHPNNRKRVIRALEFYHETGQRISEHNETERRKESPYQFAYFVLNDERAHLYARIDKRVDQMIQHGLKEEAEALQQHGCCKEMVAMQGLGYKEMLRHLEGELTLDEAVYLIKRDTRHFAKRQLTWFRRERDVLWIEKQSYAYEEEKILTYITDILRQKEIII